MLIAFRSLADPWFYDDYHLVRPFTGSEIHHALTGNWDVDNAETPDYRPPTTLFNDARAIAFGEAVVVQRLFVLAMFAAFLTVEVLVGRRLGLTTLQMALAGIIALATKDNWYNLVWITDGGRVFCGLLTAAATYFCISCALRPRLWKVVAVPVLAGAAIFVREEPIAVLPLLVPTALMALVRDSPIKKAVHEKAPKRPWVYLALIGAGLAWVTAIWYLLRTRWVPVVATTVNVKGWALLALWTLYPMGRLSSRGVHDAGTDRSLAVNLLTVLDPMSNLSAGDFTYLIWAIIFMGSLLILLFLSARSRRLAQFWLICSIVACAHGSVAVRANLLFFPIYYFSLFLGTVFGEMLTWSFLAKGLGALSLAFVIGLSARNNVIAQENMHPQSVIRYLTDQEFLWGDLAHTTVPASRRLEILERFRLLGITTNDDFGRKMPALIVDADARNRYRPDGSGKPFRPTIQFIEP